VDASHGLSAAPDSPAHSFGKEAGIWKFIIGLLLTTVGAIL
jgi:hypothetical protein